MGGVFPECGKDGGVNHPPPVAWRNRGFATAAGVLLGAATPSIAEGRRAVNAGGNAMNIIDALKRLERAGAENSRTTDKLREAAVAVAEKVENLAKGMDIFDLPRGYCVEQRQGSTYLMSDETDMEDYCPQRFALYPGSLAKPPREIVLRFAADVAGGWLDEVAEMLETRAAENTEAADQLEAAK